MADRVLGAWPRVEHAGAPAGDDLLQLAGGDLEGLGAGLAESRRENVGGSAEQEDGECSDHDSPFQPWAS